MLLLRSDDMPPGLGRRLLEDRPLRLPVLALLGGGREDSPAPAAAEDVRVAIQGTALTFAFGSAMNWYFASTREAKQPIGTSCQGRGCDSDNASGYMLPLRRERCPKNAQLVMPPAQTLHVARSHCNLATQRAPHTAQKGVPPLFAQETQ